MQRSNTPSKPTRISDPTEDDPSLAAAPSDGTRSLTAVLLCSTAAGEIALTAIAISGVKVVSVGAGAPALMVPGMLLSLVDR